MLDGRGVIEGQHSAVVEQWFGGVANGVTLWDYLLPRDPHYAEWLSLAWSNIGAPFMPLELCLEQMPKAFSADERHYEVEYRPRLDAKSALDKLVVVISDVTELRRREQAEREQRELVSVFGALVRDRTGFVSFCEEAEALLKRMAEASEGALPKLLEELHTLKGNAWVFQLRELAETCEQVEARCVEAGRWPLADEVLRLSEAFARGTRAVAPFLDAERAGTVQLASDDYAAIEQALLRGEPGRRVLVRLTQASAEPAEQVFARFASRLQVMARRLGKADVSTP